MDVTAGLPPAAGDRRAVLLDTAVAVALAGLSLAAGAYGLARSMAFTVGGTVLLLGCWVPLAWRRIAPLTAAGVSGVCFIVGVTVSQPMPNVIAAHAVVYVLAARGRRAAALSCAAALLLGSAAAESMAGWHPSAVPVAGATVLALGWGEGVRLRRARAAALVARAEQAEREREALARQAVAEERLHIARELHDLLAHTMSVVAVQAGTGRIAAQTDPAAALTALTAVEEASREALTEMRWLLGVLRADGATYPARRPSPTLGSVAELAARTNVAGVEVELSTGGNVRQLPRALELSAYRIVQEALTNAVRHAPGARVHVTVDYAPSALRIEVSDTGGPLGTAGKGHGLVGMRERTALFGGSFAAGPNTDGGFTVRAVFPLPASPATGQS
jgi:signal transduction histidine kinase